MSIGHATSSVSSPDLFVVGGGPAGLACAIAAAQLGLHVEIADSHKPPIDKACGEGLLPDALAALEQLGISIEDLRHSGRPFRGIRFIQSCETHNRSTAEAAFPTGFGLGIRRTILHDVLTDRALALGVRFHWQTVVTGIDKITEIHEATETNEVTEIHEVPKIKATRIHTSRGTFSPRWIVAADGHQSRVRAFAGLDPSSTARQRIALRQHFQIAPWSDLVEVHWGPAGQAYVTPISPSEVCIAFVGSKRFASVDSALSHFPSLPASLAAAPRNDKPRGAVTLTRRLRRVTSGNIALIGDASGSVDAVTGEGLALAFRQALALAQALAANNLAAYEHAHAHIFRLPRHISRALLLLDRHPLVRSLTLRGFQRSPKLFPHLLGVHTGHTPLRLLGTNGLVASLLAP
jgi:flavin-dependent dehydrogenase